MPELLPLDKVGITIISNKVNLRNRVTWATTRTVKQNLTPPPPLPPPPPPPPAGGRGDNVLTLCVPPSSFRPALSGA